MTHIYFKVAQLPAPVTRMITPMLFSSAMKTISKTP